MSNRLLHYAGVSWGFPGRFLDFREHTEFSMSKYPVEGGVGGNRTCYSMVDLDGVDGTEQAETRLESKERNVWDKSSRLRQNYTVDTFLFSLEAIFQS